MNNLELATEFNDGNEIQSPALGFTSSDFEILKSIERQKSGLPSPPSEYKKIGEEQDLVVNASEENGRIQYEYSATINGEKQVVLKTDQAPAEVEKQLLNARDGKLQGLEKTFNVNIARSGDFLEVNGKDLPISTPTMGELVSLEQGLLRSVPDTETASGRPLKIHIGDEGQDWGRIVGFFVPDNTLAIGHNDNLSYMTEVSIHELHHVGQSELYANKGAEEAYAKQLGWDKSSNGGWLLRAKDGSYWQHTDKGNEWLKVDKDGNPADKDGKRIDNPLNPFDHGEDSGRIQTKTDAEVREIAVVKPYSTYMGNPTEMGAALLTPYRDGREKRADLYHVSSDSYEVARKLDQQFIDSEFGNKADGQPKFIRNPDGLIVENDEKHRKEITDFESHL